MDKLSPLQQRYFDLLKTQGVLENETAARTEIARMNASDLRQAIAASEPVVPDHAWSSSRRI